MPVQNAEGSGLGPFDCWLLLRGVKTMALRMERQVANCSRIAAFLEGHPLVKKINYPGRDAHPNSAVQRRQALNGGSLLSFETNRCVPPCVGSAHCLLDTPCSTAVLYSQRQHFVLF